MPTGGESLYDEGFSDDQMQEWFEAESSRWRQRYAKHTDRAYIDHALNIQHAYRWLPQRSFAEVLGFGAGDGQELLPVLSRVEHVTVIDPAPVTPATIADVPVQSRIPSPSGRILDPDDSYDLITCFGALTCVANAPTVFRELVRCLAPDGWLLLHEPIIAVHLNGPRDAGMGREGGLPLAAYRRLVGESRLEVRRQTLCVFPLMSRLARNAYNRRALVRLDAMLCRAFAWNVHYSVSRPWHRLRPRSAFYVLHKPSL